MGFVATLWTRLETDPTLGLKEVDRGKSLHLVHESLARIDVELPNFKGVSSSDTHCPL
jgi:hypothetical protein